MKFFICDDYYQPPGHYDRAIVMSGHEIANAKYELDTMEKSELIGQVSKADVLIVFESAAISTESTWAMQVFSKLISTYPDHDRKIIWIADDRYPSGRELYAEAVRRYGDMLWYENWREFEEVFLSQVGDYQGNLFEFETAM